VLLAAPPTSTVLGVMNDNYFEANIIVLPDKALLNILEHLPNEDLYRLAPLCRRLNHTVLTVYLSRLNIHDPTISIDLTAQTNALDAISGLHIALFVPLVERITCHFPQFDAADFYRSLSRLQKLVSRLSLVGHVTLHVRRWIYGLSFSNDAAQREAWSASFERLCKTLVSKSCSGLEVVNMNGGDRCTFTLSTAGVKAIENQSTPSLFGKAIQSMINIGRGQHWGKDLKVRHPSSEITNIPQEGFALTSTDIRSPDIFDFAHVERGLPILSSLQSLTLACSDIWREEWSDILAQLTRSTPGLCAITILPTTISPIDLLEFAGRIPHLSHLIILPGPAQVPTAVWD
jgi:hypothetical protein